MTDDYRLLDVVTPIRYTITLEPDLEKFTFDGAETVEIDIKKDTKSILLNSSELEITSVELLSGKEKIKPEKIEPDEYRQVLSLLFKDIIKRGTYKISIKFKGTLNDQLRGFYRSKYTDSEGRTRHIATTQFEATDARKAFPCWDDPAAKAIFKISTVIRNDLTAISNMPVEDEKKTGDKNIVTFKETPRMSTYLLALIVGDFKCVEKTHKGTLLRIWATKGNEKKGRFALGITAKLLDYFNEYFGIPYPLEKLDQIAIPDFAAGAMENWGAITYREVALLFDEKNSNAGTKQRIAEVVAHEMAHQWFGDLVTMEWWDDLWLNESFASWMGTKSTDKIFPEWRMWTQFISADTEAGMSLDALQNSHPIEARVNDPSEIRELFDAISYSKGAATMRMLEQFLGEETFRRGLKKYLAENSYANARTEDLWAAMDSVSGKPVTEIMGTWIKQTGFPVLSVKAVRSKNEIRLSLTQSRFLYNDLIKPNKDPTIWKIPVDIDTGNGKTSLVMESKKKNVTIPAKNTAGSLLKLNPGQNGFYRTDYEPEDWKKLEKAAAKMKLSANDRLGLQNDAYAFMKSGRMPATAFITLLESYRNENDATILADMAASLRGIEILLFDEPALRQFREFARSIFAPIAKRVGWDKKPGEGHLDAMRRSVILSQSGYYDDKETLKEAEKRFGGYVKNPSSLHPDIRNVVLNLAARQGGKKTYDRLWDIENKVTLHEEKLRLLIALCHFEKQDLLKETLKRLLDTNRVRSQDTISLMSQIAATKQGRDLAWDFMKANWKELDRRYGDGGFAITRLVELTGLFTTREKYAEVEKFFETHSTPSAERTVRQSLERIRLNAIWLEKNSKDISALLKKLKK